MDSATGSASIGPELGMRRLPIPRLDRLAAQKELPRLLAVREPAILTGMMESWDARRWEFGSLRERIGQISINALVDLPKSGIPYFWTGDFHRRMSFAEFIDRMESSPESQSYLSQKDIRQFPGLERDFDFGALAPQASRAPTTSIWLGTEGTRSGLHFDRRDNFFAQIAGRKKVFLAAPSQARRLYPINDMFEKSSVDPEEPDYQAHPRLRDCVLMEGEVEAGEILFIPRLWWHHLRSTEASISLNHWFGEEVSLWALLRVVTAGGIRHWLTLARDFFRFGLLGRPYETRLLSDMPSGVLMYGIVREGIRRRLFASSMKVPQRR